LSASDTATATATTTTTTTTTTDSVGSGAIDLVAHVSTVWTTISKAGVYTTVGIVAGAGLTTHTITSTSASSNIRDSVSSCSSFPGSFTFVLSLLHIETKHARAPYIIF